MKDSLYHFIAGVLDLFLWNGRLIGEENLPQRGPAVFIANHQDATGPIGACCSIPLRLHPWIIADMMDKDLAPAWMREDFVERQLHIQPPASRWIAQALCKIALPLFYSLGCIPVYRNDYDSMQGTYNMSMDVLRQGKFLLIFPEDNRLPADLLTKMQPFQHSFARLGEMYYAETGECLEFYPVTIHATKQLVVGKPVAFNPLNTVGQERRRLKNLMEDTIIARYMQFEGENASEEPPLQHDQDPTKEIS